MPLDPTQLADDARAAVAAGAHALHVHPRSADGSETLLAPESDAVVAALREACPNVPVGLTTGAWIEPDLRRRLESIAGWRERPDFASVNFYEDGATAVARLLLEHGIDFEAGLATVADARTLAASGVGSDRLRILIEVEEVEPAAAVAAASGIATELDRLGIRSAQLHHGLEIATWAVLETALEHGRDIRIGLEDTLVLPDGQPARDNVELVATAAALIKARVATDDPVRPRKASP